MNKFLLLFVISLSVFSTDFNSLIAENSVNGGVKIIDFKTNLANPQAYFLKQKVLVNKIKNGHFQAIIGIPISLKSGIYSLKIQDFSTKIITFEVKTSNYKKQYITLTGKKKKFINLSKEHINRVLKEKSIINRAKQIYSQKLLITSFSKPSDGIITSVFGSQRFFNNKPKRPHSGMDFANKLGSKISPIASGKVILIGDFYFNGKSILLDHGKGLMSFYIHLNKILVQTGDMVNINDKIATMGSSGRTTGVNLHLSTYLNKVAINPNIFLKL